MEDNEKGDKFFQKMWTFEKGKNQFSLNVKTYVYHVYFPVSDDSGIPSSRYDVNQMQEQFNLQRAKMRDLYMMKVSSIFYAVLVQL